MYDPSMAREPQRKLVIPALLTVCALGASLSCKDESGDDTDAEASSGTGADTTDSGSDTSGADTTVSGENECFDILEMSACLTEAAFECRWNPDDNQCQPNCPAYTEQASCDEDRHCMWIGSACTDGAA